MRMDRIDEARRVFVGQATNWLRAGLEIVRMLYLPDPRITTSISAKLLVSR